jgi:hypothetical protein
MKHMKEYKRAQIALPIRGGPTMWSRTKAGRGGKARRQQFGRVRVCDSELAQRCNRQTKR